MTGPGKPNCRTPSLRGFAAWACLVLALIGALARAAAAHDEVVLSATADVRADASFVVDVRVGRDALPTDAAPGPAGPDIADLPADPVTRAQAHRVLAAFAVLFDGRPVPASVRWTGLPDDDNIRLRLTGAVPDGARTLALRNDLPGGWAAGVRHGKLSTPDVVFLEPSQAMEPIVLDQPVVEKSALATILEFVGHGFTHILPLGLDHVLFVLGLFLMSPRLKPLLLQVTAFTLAHTVTLALSVTGVFALPASVVEPLIAASIVYVAVENVCMREVRPWRVLLVFAFGLLHGLGFAGVLQDLGLPQGGKALALVSFNVGVELGQLTVLLGAWAALALPFGKKPWYRSRVVVPLSLAIAAVGLYWAVTRVLGE